jgi:hypothetical protein
MRSPHRVYGMADALRWAAQVAEALTALHAASPPYIHGDVTADNVFIQDGAPLGEAAVKLGDLKPHRCLGAGRGEGGRSVCAGDEGRAHPARSPPCAEGQPTWPARAPTTRLPPRRPACPAQAHL